MPTNATLASTTSVSVIIAVGSSAKAVVTYGALSALIRGCGEPGPPLLPSIPPSTSG